MLAYNGSIPGPTLKVRQGSHLVVNVDERRRHGATVHWHGLGSTIATTGRTRRRRQYQSAALLVSPRVPDPASTGTTRTSARTTARSSACTATSSSSRRSRTTGPRPPRVDADLDDILIEDGKIAPFSPRRTTYVGDGPIRQRLLVGGEAELALTPNRRDRPPLPHEHRQHARVQRRARPARG